MRNFYWTSLSMESCLSSPAMLYARVNKCGNEFIRANLKAACGGTSLFELATPRSPTSPLYVFTFVRDPLDHFESGYREALGRTFRACCSKKSLHQPQGPCPIPCGLFRRDAAFLARYMYVLSAMLAGSLDPAAHGDAFGHLFPMASSVWPLIRHAGSASSTTRATETARPKVSLIVGRLSSIEEDWDAMCNLSGACPHAIARYGQLDKTVGGHPDSQGGLARNWSAGLRVLWRQQPTWLHAVETLLHIDYDCFGGVRPSGAKRLQETSPRSAATLTTNSAFATTHKPSSNHLHRGSSRLGFQSRTLALSWVCILLCLLLPLSFWYISSLTGQIRSLKRGKGYHIRPDGSGKL